MQLDQAFIKRLASPMNITWSQIGSDIFQCAEECGETVDNEGCVEACIDADRLEFNGGDAEANKLVREAVLEHGYKPVLKFLCKHFQYA